MTEFLTTVSTEESIVDNETSFWRGLIDGDPAANPFLGRKHRTDDDERPKACEKAW